MTIKLYHCHRARSMRPLWTLEEMGIDYELIVMKFPPRATYEGYLDINPLGTVPTMVDGDVTMTESAGISQYLVDLYGPTDIALEPGAPDYGIYLNWLHRSDATLTFPQTLVLRYTKLEPMERRQPQVVEDYTRWFFSRLRALELALKDRDYLCANKFTIADIAVGYALVLGESLGMSESFKPNTQKYFAMLKARPAYQRAAEL
ncbi:MAG TPA: glutathione S-transferase family protein [Porticoccaceae bacterium]|nr:glutathione S-transferase family protein [Gammaproteobacteria bacterium]HIL60148.1 glutathione S-transferase family protein [Porticoccaceae bacterium]